MKRRLWRRDWLLALTLCSLSAAAPYAQGADWVGTTADLNDPNNWSPVGAPTTGVVINFTGATTQNNPTFAVSVQGPGSTGIGTMTVTGGQTAALNITNIGAAGQVFRFAGNAGLTINSGAGAVSFGGTGSSFFINMGTGTSNFVNNSANTATINSNVTLNASGGMSPNVAFGGTGNWTIAGIFSNTVQSVSKSGNGTLTLSNNSSGFAGNITVTAGVLAISNSGALGTTAGTTTISNTAGGTVGGNGTVLQLSNNITVGEAINLVAFDGDRRATILNASGTNTLTGPITLLGGNTITAATNLNFSVSSGQLIINGPVTADASWALGGLLIRGAGGSGVINGTVNIGSHNLIKTDPNTWTVASTGNTWATTHVANGVLIVGANNALDTSAPVQMGQSGASSNTLQLNGFSQTIGGLFRAAGNTSTSNVIGGSATQSILTINNTANFSHAGVIGGSGTNHNNLALVKDGPGTQTLTAANTYTGPTTVQGGTLAIGSGGSINGVGNTNVTGTGTLRVDAGGSVGGGAGTTTVQSGGTLVVNGSIASGTGGVNVVSGGTVTGTGTINRTVTIGAGGIDAPGVGVGTGTFANSTWMAGGALEFEISSATGTPGVEWDLRQITSDLNISDLVNGPFDINVVGLPADFDSGENYEWEFVTFDNLEAGTVSLGSLNSYFNITGVDHSAGIFSIIQTENGLALSFAAIPEPTSVALWCLLGVVGMAWNFRGYWLRSKPA